MTPGGDSEWTIWRQLPRALLYPLELESSLVIILGTFVIWFCSTSLFALPLALTFAIGLTQFLLVNLRHVATGGEHPPRIGIAEFRQLGATPVKLLLAAGAWASVAHHAAVFSPAAGIALTVAGYLFLPAFTTLLALEDSLSYALRPARLLRFVLRGGLIYTLFAGAIGVLLWSASLRIDAQALIFDLPPASRLFQLMAGMYLATAASYLLGRIANVAHDFRPPDDHRVVAEDAADPDSPAAVATRLDERLRKGDRDAVLAEWDAHGHRDHAFQQALLDALLRLRAWPLVPKQAQRTVTLLLAANRRIDALQLVMRTLTTHDSFATASAGEWRQLCETAEQTGRHDWLDVLARKAPEKFPGDAALLEIALVHARYLAMKSGDVAAAAAALTPYADWRSHPLHPRLERFRLTLQEMLQG